jgi:hypothetical protein
VASADTPRLRGITLVHGRKYDIGRGVGIRLNRHYSVPMRFQQKRTLQNDISE